MGQSHEHSQSAIGCIDLGQRQGIRAKERWVCVKVAQEKHDGRKDEKGTAM